MEILVADGASPHLSVQSTETQDVKQLMLTAGRQGDLTLLKELLQLEAETWDPEIVIEACAQGHQHIVEWYLNEFISMDHFDPQREGPFPWNHYMDRETWEVYFDLFIGYDETEDYRESVRLQCYSNLMSTLNEMCSAANVLLNKNEKEQNKRKCRDQINRFIYFFRKKIDLYNSTLNQ